MVKRVLSAVLGFLSLCLAAQQTEAQIITAEELSQTGALDVPSALALYRPDIFSTVDGSILIHGLPVLTLLEGRRLPISSELGRMGSIPVVFLSAVEVQRVNGSPVYGTDSPGSIVNLLLNRMVNSGEVGVFYGRGGHGREDKQAYFISGVGDDKFQITGGASYQESSGRFPRVSSLTPPY